ncbi:flippase [Aromatoleum sp.]|uniref:flippase n=1 Tax=Aromatoleum sp. TaxID=2307007 RepID=UPI002FCA7E55
MKSAVMKNLVWLFGERVALTLLVFLSNVYVIRYLGAERFGELALFQVYFALTLVATEFGLRRVFLALGRSRAIRLVLSATVTIKAFLGAGLAVVLLTAIVYLHAPAEYYLLVGVVLLAPLEAYVYHFEARLQNDLLARIRIGLAIVFATGRVGLCLAGAGVATIAATYVLPAMLLGLTCRVLVRRHALPALAATASARGAAVRAHVLRRSSYLFGSALILQLHARADQLLLHAFAGTGELGLYAGAYKFLEQLLMIPVILNGVLLPAMSRWDEGRAAEGLEQTYFATFLIALGLAGVVGLGAGPIIGFVLGPGFEASARILEVLALGIPGLFLANVSGLYYSLHGLEHLGFIRNLAGVVTGVALGLILIPRYGAIGAAWSMVASYTFTAFGIEWVSSRFRRNVQLKARAFAAMFSIRSYGALIALVGRQGGPQ